ncbi:glycosyltransferase family 2 protein [Aliiroseovarius crassostreae]|uniref:glycosyltransferase family 2 protein n=1 Tax=Aliiroseovarius crassostreae TaxID=154981 RepID=UPI0022004E77|nr:glycosyltransferase family 2 protein [Aliiroseovarius crassostreae]UWQ03853.1 glycosyltransferase family 2 protein [Aliiroseovarius crassostreae]
MAETKPGTSQSGDTCQGDGRPLISLVVPVFNEEQAIAPFFEALTQPLSGLADRFQFEILFVNDGSSDRTESRIAETSSAPWRVRLVNLSRNFGKEAALAAGLAHADGDAVIPMDVDLQDPPELICDMVEKWAAGAKIVNARRSSRERDTWMKRTSAGAFYRVFNALADHPIPRNVGDFRLLDREVVDVVLLLGERARFNKGIFSWVGFDVEEVAYERPAREAGETVWSYWKLWKLALDGIFASSTAPLRIWTYMGMILFCLSLAYSAFILLRTLIYGVDTPGYASTLILILSFGGMNMFILGIIGEYVGRIYEEVRRRPLYVVRSVVDDTEGAGRGS